jgi:hypothetical protein
MIFMIIVIFAAGYMQLHLLNCAMKYYDQMEAVPVYQTCLMIVWMGVGLVVLDEKRFYSWP